MMRRQRNVAPLIALLAFEVAAIFGLTTLGSVSSMQVPWGSPASMMTWLQTGTIDDIAAPLIRLFGLVLAYWMLTTTTLSVIAQLSRIPVAIRATNMVTLPIVRRTVSAALVASIATTTLVGSTTTAAFADEPFMMVYSANDSSSMAASDDDMSVPTPAPAPPDDGTSSDEPLVVPSDSELGSTIETVPAVDQILETTDDTITVDPVNESDSVPTPRVGAEANAIFESTTTTTSTTAVPAAPRSNVNVNVNTSSTSGNATQAPVSNQTPVTANSGTQVLGVAEHRVVDGDNLWNISRDALAAATNRAPSQISNEEIRVYWLKVIDANVGHLRSGDPHWIFAGEVITLPAN